MEESQHLHFPIRHNYSGGNGTSSNNNNKVLKDHSLQNASGHDGSGHLADSGYNSYQSFNASSSVVRSVLATIDEDNEADSSFEDVLRCSETPRKVNSILTPTTAASIEQISNFHLTTPNSVTKEPAGVVKRRVLSRKPSFQNMFVQRTPDKAAVGADFLRTAGTPVRSDRKAGLGNLTPRKNKASAKRKLASFREKLYSDGDSELLRSSPELNDSIDGDCKKLDQEEISPIFHAKRRRNSVIDDLIRSSTPKTASFSANFHVESRENINWETIRQGKVVGPMRKPLTLRKFQSFSPSKMQNYRKWDSVLKDNAIATNRKAPLQRQNAVSEDSPLKESIKPSTTARKYSPEASLELSFEPSSEINITPVKGINLCALLDAPILPQSSTEDNFKETDLDLEISQVPSFDDCSFTPSKPSCSTESFLKEDSITVRDAPVTDLNKSIPSILEQESPFIISALNIPKTPTSANKPRRLKRLTSRNLSSTKKDKPRSKPPSPKLRSQSIIPGTYRRSYVGVERLNILKRLNEKDKDAMEMILDYLTDSDLVRVISVSRGWRAIIETHRRTNRRLRDYLSREAQVKENLDRTGSSRENSLLLGLGKTLSCDTGKEGASVASVLAPRQPFSMCNSIDGSLSAGELKRLGSVQKSPPVSPSKRKFRENQKIASHLKKSERLKACPRCEKPSRIILSKATIRLALASGTVSQFSRAAAKLEKSYTLPETTSHSIITADSVDCSPASPTNPDRIRRNLFSTSLLQRSCSVDVRTPCTRSGTARRRNSTDIVASSASLLERKMTTNIPPTEESQCDYAICSGKNCGFQFCIKCLCEYHPDSMCKDLAPNSPSKEEEPSHNVACSKQSRRSLLRLRK